MPFETIAPAPNVEWWAEFLYPGTVPPGTAIPTAVLGAQDYWPKPAYKAGATALSAGTTGGAGVTKGYVNRFNRLCARALSVGVAWAESWTFPWWSFRGENTANLNPGYMEAEPCRVAWFRIGFVLSAVDATLGDGTGFSFIPYNGGAIAANLLPGGGAFAGGFGLVCDGAGGWRYRSWNAAAAQIDSVDVPVAALPDVTKFSTADIFIRDSVPGAVGWVTIRINGVDVITERPYGALILAPTTLNANAYTYAFCQGGNDPGSGTILSWWVHARFGRFLPDGVEVSS